MKLRQLVGSFSILRLDAKDTIPDWLSSSQFYSVSRSRDELSIVCESHVIQGKPEKREDDWKCLMIEGPLDFSLIGVLSSISTPLAEAGISIMAISTFETDYFLVKSEKMEKAKTVLRDAGFEVASESR